MEKGIREYGNKQEQIIYTHHIYAYISVALHTNLKINENRQNI